jgi:hypothetical protein
VTEDTLTWDNHISQLISRLNSACYAIAAVKAMLSRKALRMLYISYVHSHILWQNFWGITPLIVLKYSECKKKINMNNSKKMDSCTQLFKTMKMLSFYLQYIFSLLLHVVNNKHLFTKNLKSIATTLDLLIISASIINLIKYKKELIMKKSKFLINLLLT